ncbi:MAG: hypothetical protein KDA65_05165 [Planctomycetaceae bacterium]|nr:hypothetical protein [Planctomycetaceae bacterium]
MLLYRLFDLFGMRPFFHHSAHDSMCFGAVWVCGGVDEEEISPSFASQKSEDFPMPTEKTDIVKELRLRSWARQNYVALADRSKDWHPIVLNEMQRRDAEILATEAEHAEWQQMKAAPTHVVPLIPSSLLALHAAHQQIPAPKFLSQPQMDPLAEELARAGWF